MHNVIGNITNTLQKEIDSKQTKERSKSQLLHLNQAAAAIAICLEVQPMVPPHL